MVIHLDRVRGHLEIHYFLGAHVVVRWVAHHLSLWARWDLGLHNWMLTVYQATTKLTDCIMLRLSNDLTHSCTSSKNRWLPNFGCTFIIPLLNFAQNFILFLAAPSSKTTARSMSIITDIISYWFSSSNLSFLLFYWSTTIVAIATNVWVAVVWLRSLLLHHILVLI